MTGSAIKGAANKVVGKLLGEVAMKSVAKKVAAKALTKTWYYPIVKKIASMLGQKIVKTTFSKGVSKAVPLIGGAISGGLTFATFKPMSCSTDRASFLSYNRPSKQKEHALRLFERVRRDGSFARMVLGYRVSSV